MFPPGKSGVALYRSEANRLVRGIDRPNDQVQRARPRTQTGTTGPSSALRCNAMVRPEVAHKRES
ncbi:hypothetical protein CCP4SC76_4690004 [Gammaproteobacteria bacterium]